MLTIDDRNDFVDGKLYLSDCSCLDEPHYMYSVCGEYATTICDFWTGYNVFPLKVIHNYIENFDDLDVDDKRFNLRIEVIHSGKELKQLLDKIAWKLIFDDFYITNSKNDVKIENKLRPDSFINVPTPFPTFDLALDETVTEMTCDGDYFTIATNDRKLAEKEQIFEIIKKD